ncbi:MAG: GNAT family N-acetyltransferase [Traorella sp.]
MQEYGLNHYENESSEDDIPLLEEEKITYSVLVSILRRPCTHIFTNHSSVIICYSSDPYPVWIWCKDMEKEDVKRIAECLKKEFPITEGYRYNLSYELFEELQKVDEYFNTIPVKMSLLSYRLSFIRPFLKKCEGRLAIPQLEDLDLLAQYWHDSVKEMEEFDFDLKHCTNTVLKKIEDGSMYIWLDGDDKIVALCSCDMQNQICKISGVYTLPNERRKGYALNLVKEVTQRILDDDLIPILYTNASFEASNACYKKIGYKPVGKLCTVGN